MINNCSQETNNRFNTEINNCLCLHVSMKLGLWILLSTMSESSKNFHINNILQKLIKRSSKFLYLSFFIFFYFRPLRRCQFIFDLCV